MRAWIRLLASGSLSRSASHMMDLAWSMLDRTSASSAACASSSGFRSCARSAAPGQRAGRPKDRRDQDLLPGDGNEGGAAVLRPEVGARLGPPAAVVSVLLLASVAFDSPLLLIQCLLLLWDARQSGHSPHNIFALKCID